jgi:hypothetical protein
LKVFEKWGNKLDTGRVDDDQRIKELFGNEPRVLFLAGDHFSGVDCDWLLDHLALQPGDYRVHLSPYEESDSLSIFLDGEEIDPLEKGEGVPLGPGIDFWENPVATIGNPAALDADMFSLTLYRGGSWLVSIWIEVHEDYLPISKGELGREKLDAELGPDIWRWVVEVVKEWAAAGVKDDLPVASEFVDVSEEWFVKQVVQAAEGGRGVVTVNGVVVFQPSVSGN